MNIKIITNIAAAMLWLSTPTVQADTMDQKFIRGAAAVGTGILELPANLNKQTEAHGALGFPIGFFIGGGMVALREVVGVYELISAPIPLPTDYSPILQPEYPWEGL